MGILIKNGTIVTSKSCYRAEVLVEGERIVEIADKIIPESGMTVLDAKGKYLFPGAIDVHVHLQLPFCGTVSSDDFLTGTRAAAHGGVTTVIDFAIQSKGATLKEAVEARKKEADPKVCVDYGLHVGVTDWNERTKKEIARIIEAGIPSFKFFMIYKKQGWMADDGALYGAFLETARHGGMVGVHAENPYLIDMFTDELIAAGKKSCYNHALSRPNFTEAEAVKRAIYLAEQTNGNLYIVHLSTREAAEEVYEGKLKGVNVYAETGPQYLMLTDEKFKLKTGHLYATCPPIRSKEDNEALWEALQQGVLEVLATDHCAFSSRQKAMWKGDFRNIPFGMPGVETILPIAYSEGVGKKRFTVNKLVDLVSTNPAKLFGLFPKKGVIQVGSDADIVIYDPKAKKKISAKTHHQNIDYSPFEGLTVTGYPETTLLRGKVVVDKGKYLGTPGEGKFVKRNAGSTLE